MIVKIRVMAFSLPVFLLAISLVVLIIAIVLTSLAISKKNTIQSDNEKTIENYLTFSVAASSFGVFVIVVVLTIAAINFAKKGNSGLVEKINILLLFLTLITLLVSGLLAFYATIK